MTKGSNTSHKLRIYVDTSVIDGCFDTEFSKWSKPLFEEFKAGSKLLMLSDITLVELKHAPENVREIIKEVADVNIISVSLNDEAGRLADKYLKEKAISKKYFNDALHIAIATVNSAHVLVSWNFKHIVNISRIRLYNSVNLKYGYPELEIRTPMEVLDEKDYEENKR
jgi:predicted nucleic acid-binding protein